MGGKSITYSLSVPLYGVFKYKMNDKGLTDLEWLDGIKTEEDENDPLGLGDLLKRYFICERINFGDIPIDYGNINSTYRRILEIVRSIPYGKVHTYSEIGEMIGKPRYARVVGNAMRINPCPIVIPCHRVIGKNGLGGYGFGIQKKLLLLKLEGVMVC
ncbi:MAG TPA: MGMT family protein [bacterium]|nr:MGMT family protein [bacterium]